MITLNNVTKFYMEHGKKKYIVKNSSLEIPDDVSIAILGKKGSGRTTLLRMLGGIDFPSIGTITSNNTFSWLFAQQAGFKLAMSGRQNIKFVGRIYNKSEDEITKMIADVQDFSELGDYIDKPMEKYPMPLKIQFAFGLSLFFDFDYILLDNMLSVIASSDSFRVKSQKALREKIKHCNVLLASNSIPDIREICDATIVIDQEKLHYFDNVEAGITYYQKMIGLTALQSQKAIKGMVYCEDGKTFQNIDLAAIHYKVKPISIMQAINFNKGSHVYLKKVFWGEKGSLAPFQNWSDTKVKETVICSDGIIFEDALEASKFYMDRNPNKKISINHVATVLKEHKGQSKVLDIKFTYLSEYK